MAAHDRIFGSDLPAISDKIGSLIVVDEQMFNFEDDFTQRFTLDHYMDGSLSQISGSQEGRHRQVTMLENTAPTAKENSGVLYTKDDSGDTELYYKDDATSGNEIQVTSDGVVSHPEITTSLSGVLSGFAVLSGTTPSVGSLGGTATLSISYPSGFTQSNSIIMSFIANNTKANGYLGINSLLLRPASSNYLGITIHLRGSDILLTTYYFSSSQPYILLLGKLT